MHLHLLVVLYTPVREKRKGKSDSSDLPLFKKLVHHALGHQYTLLLK
jgi:hypothetical protein